MKLKLTVSASREALDTLKEAAGADPTVELIDTGESVPDAVFSPLSLVEIASITLAVYSTTLEPVVPMLRRLLFEKNTITLTTRYGSVKINGDAPLTEKELLAAIKPLLPKP
jgi:hypothetical protein